MFSPRKRGKLPVPQGRQLSEPSLPLHLALGWIINKLFPVDHDCQPIPIYSPQFTSDILRLIAREVFEVASIPATFVSLRDELDPLIRAETKELSKRNEKKRIRGQVVQDDFAAAEDFNSWLSSFADMFTDVAEGCAFLDRLEKELREKLNFSDDDEPTEFPEPIERHSPLGVFCRNLLNILRKLAFDETAHLAREVAKWCGISVDGPSRAPSMWSLDRRSAMEDTLDKRIGAMQDYQAANAAGDWSHALASLRKFYDYQFPSSGRGQHQHALLNIASFHYMTGGLESAQAAVEEAIRVARTAGDKGCLQHCLGLLKRLRTETTSAAFSSTEKVRIHQASIPSARLADSVTPMDELWSLRAALDLGEPVHVAFRRIHVALGKEMQTERGVGEEDRRTAKLWRSGETLDLAAWHATQAGLWSMLGSNILAEHHEHLAMGDMTPWEDGQLTVLLASAQRAAEKAEYDDALSILLDMSVVQGISMAQYHRWARVVWSILERRVQMRDDVDTMSYLHSVQPTKNASSRFGPGGPTRETGHPRSITVDTFSSDSSPNEDGLESDFARRIILTQEHVRSLLRKATKLLESSSPAPAHVVLPHVLASVQLASQLGLWGLYRFGIVVFCEVLLSMEGMGEKVIGEMERVWNQILESDDQEVIARGALCWAKAKLESILNGSSSSWHGVREHLEHCLAAATKLESRSLIAQATQLLLLSSELAEEDDVSPERKDDWVRRYESPIASEGEAHMQDVRKIVEIVKMVGIRVAEGWN